MATKSKANVTHINSGLQTAIVALTSSIGHSEAAEVAIQGVAYGFMVADAQGEVNFPDEVKKLPLGSIHAASIKGHRLYSKEQHNANVNVWVEAIVPASEFKPNENMTDEAKRMLGDKYRARKQSARRGLILASILKSHGVGYDDYTQRGPRKMFTAPLAALCAEGYKPDNADKNARVFIDGRSYVSAKKEERVPIAGKKGQYATSTVAGMFKATIAQVVRAATPVTAPRKADASTPDGATRLVIAKPDTIVKAIDAWRMVLETDPANCGAETKAAIDLILSRLATTRAVIARAEKAKAEAPTTKAGKEAVAKSDAENKAAVA